MPFGTCISGSLRKMRTEPAAPVCYTLMVGDARVCANDLLGRPVRLVFSGGMHCLHCGRASKKSFNQGYCYPCFRKLAECDTCITRPETCHYHQGTCRDPDWGLQHCLRDHIVYLANTSGVKVGITRATQVPTRWMDQGAVAALPVYRVRERLLSGLLEVALKAHVGDRTNWRVMLQGTPEPVDLAHWRDRLLIECRPDAEALRERFGLDAVTELPVADGWSLQYPVLEYPLKVRSINPDKQPVVEGTLQGIKGQYLIFDSGVINLRTYAGYDVTLHY